LTVANTAGELAHLFNVGLENKLGEGKCASAFMHLLFVERSAPPPRGLPPAAASKSLAKLESVLRIFALSLVRECVQRVCRF
jgi:hypothetical protein